MKTRNIMEWKLKISRNEFDKLHGILYNLVKLGAILK